MSCQDLDRSRKALKDLASHKQLRVVHVGRDFLVNEVIKNALRLQLNVASGAHIAGEPLSSSL